MSAAARASRRSPVARGGALACGGAPRLEALARRRVGGLRVLRRREGVLVARQAEVAEVQARGELRDEAGRRGELALHLRDLEVGGDAGLLGGKEEKRQDQKGKTLHSAK